MTHIEIHRRLQRLEAKEIAVKEQAERARKAIQTTCGQLGHIMKRVELFVMMSPPPMACAVCGKREEKPAK